MKEPFETIEHRECTIKVYELDTIFAPSAIAGFVYEIHKDGKKMLRSEPYPITEVDNVIGNEYETMLKDARSLCFF